MEYCQYHPLSPATHYCPKCDLYTCDKCVNDKLGLGPTAKCFQCDKILNSLGASQTATPFWRRINESFRYPLSRDALTLIIGGAILTSFARLIPFGAVIGLLITGALLKYNFTCLQDTARGRLKTPKIREAYQGGLILILQLFFIYICVGITIVLSYHYLGAIPTLVISTLIIGSMPAMIMNFALNNNLFSALNPLANYQLFRAIGLPYLLFLGFMVIMGSSIMFIAQLLNHLPTLIATVGESAAVNYYTMVIMHMMGYLVFQYQAQIGFFARDDNEGHTRSELDRQRAHIDIELKEGQYEKVFDLFVALIQQHRKDRILHADFFNYLCAIKDKSNLQKLANNYFHILTQLGLLEQLYSEFRRCVILCPNYQPDDPHIAHTLAERTFASGDFKMTARLLNGLHKAHPTYMKIIDVYDLLAETLQHIPNMTKKADTCKKLAAKLRAEQEKPQQQPPKKRAPIPPKKKGASLLSNSAGALKTDFQSPKSPLKGSQDSTDSATKKDNVRPVKFKGTSIN